MSRLISVDERAEVENAMRVIDVDSDDRYLSVIYNRWQLTALQFSGRRRLGT